jgi:hypothetical protein
VKQNALFCTVTATQRVKSDYRGTARCEVCQTIWSLKFFVYAVASHYTVLSEMQSKERGPYNICMQRTARVTKRAGAKYPAKL